MVFGGFMIKEFDKKITVWLTEEKYNELKKEKNFSEIIRKIIDEYLERKNGK